jgi:hypothetical protein
MSYTLWARKQGLVTPLPSPPEPKASAYEYSSALLRTVDIERLENYLGFREEDDLDYGFKWALTQQGGLHWGEIYDGERGLSEEDVSYLEGLVRAYYA